MSLSSIKDFYENKCFDPQEYFGLHTEGNEKIVRFFMPATKDGFIELKGEKIQAKKVDEFGIFQVSVPEDTQQLDYKIIYPFGAMHDPYGFSSMIGELDFHLFSLGIHYELYNLLGAHICEQKNILGTRFCVWAPNASKVTVRGDFNSWDGSMFPMRKHYCGIWEIFLPIDCRGQKYKYDIYTQERNLRTKADPFGFAFEKRPYTATVVCDINAFQWTDDLWINSSVKDKLNKPINIYEVHLGSWKKGESEFLNYRELAPLLADYCKEMGFTHIELLPIMEHPLDESWGYQVTGYFAPTSRYGSFQDFQYFVNHMHENHIGVILDWVPAHFPLDDFSLNKFDGTSLYEYQDPLMGYHPHWSTAIFNFASKYVTNFLIVNALFWLEKLHIDGLRVDAVASLLYLDYGREPGRWIANREGSNLNLEAIEFLKHLNSIIHQRYPKALMIAEESSSFPKVSFPPEEGGLGFDLKWKMGWMNDSLHYFSKDPVYRKFEHEKLTFSMWYAYNERFLLPLSHDEVVHEKKSLINKLGSSSWIQFANLRLLYSYMMCHPGKKLIFMGAEIGQREEWNCKTPIRWELLEYHEHFSMQKMVKDLNHFYLNNDSFWRFDFEPKGFEWLIVDDKDNSVLAFLRKSEKKQHLCLHNCTPMERYHYRVPIKSVQSIYEVFNTDLACYGGSDKKNTMIEKTPDYVELTLAPLATHIFEVNR